MGTFVKNYFLHCWVLWIQCIANNSSCTGYGIAVQCTAVGLVFAYLLLHFINFWWWFLLIWIIEWWFPDFIQPGCFYVQYSVLV